jgi:hypothetical protein
VRFDSGYFASYGDVAGDGRGVAARLRDRTGAAAASSEVLPRIFRRKGGGRGIQYTNSSKKAFGSGLSGNGWDLGEVCADRDDRRAADQVRVSIRAARPILVGGHRSAEADRLRGDLEELTGGRPAAEHWEVPGPQSPCPRQSGRSVFLEPDCLCWTEVHGLLYGVPLVVGDVLFQEFDDRVVIVLIEDGGRQRYAGARTDALLTTGPNLDAHVRSFISSSLVTQPSPPEGTLIRCSLRGEGFL